MKKIIATVALVTAVAAVTAQTVTSANIVGYNKDVGPAGLHISGFAFQGDDSTPGGVFGDQLPLGTKIYTYANPGGYTIATYEEVFDYGTYTFIPQWNPNTQDLGGANGFWVENLSGAEQTAILSGEVLMDDSVTNSIVIGLQLLSNPYPVQATVDSLGFTPSLGDKIYKYDGGYTISTYEEVFDYGTYTFIPQWNPSTVSIGVGEGFWYEAVAPATWVATKPF